MQPLTKEKKEEIIKKLNEKGVKNTCPMCGHQNFIIADGYFNSPMQQGLSGLVIGGPTIPAIPIVCTNCGFISQHALGVLDLLPKEELKKDDPQL